MAPLDAPLKHVVPEDGAHQAACMSLEVALVR